MQIRAIERLCEADAGWDIEAFNYVRDNGLVSGCGESHDGDVGVGCTEKIKLSILQSQIIIISYCYLIRSYGIKHLQHP